jgi:hypothetical protein
VHVFSSDNVNCITNALVCTQNLLNDGTQTLDLEAERIGSREKKGEEEKRGEKRGEVGRSGRSGDVRRET